MSKIASKASFILPVAVWMCFFDSCNNPTEGAGPTNTATIQIDTVRASLLSTTFDTLTLYVKIEHVWGLLPNPTRADSLANWFAQSQWRISDMWFPVGDFMCARAVLSLNEVYIRMERPMKLTQPLGYWCVDRIDYCFSEYKHYKFVRGKSG